MEQTKAMRSWSFGSLNLSSSFSSTMRLRWGLMSRPRPDISAISFCDCEITTAMSVVRMTSISRVSRSRCSADNAGSCSSFSSRASRADQNRWTLS